MVKRDSAQFSISFGYKGRRWSAKVTKSDHSGRAMFSISYQPVEQPDLVGHFNLLPPTVKSPDRLWKQYLRHMDENALQVDFINAVVFEIIKWQNSNG